MEVSLENIREFDNNFSKKTKYKIVQGVLRKSYLENVSINQSALSKVSFKFNHTITPPNLPRTDQGNSGRCWIFASLNVLRLKLANHYKLNDFELSQAYIAKFDKLERCNTALELVYDLFKQGKKRDAIEYSTLIQQITTDGGTWPMFSSLILKYGIVPKEIYPDSLQARSTGDINYLLKKLISKATSEIDEKMDLKEFRDYKKTILEQCYRLLNACYGETPKKFKYTFKETNKEHEYSPLSFYNKVVKSVVNVKKFVSICNYPIEKYDTVLSVEYLQCVLKNGDDVRKKMENTYLNLDQDTFKEAVFKSITKNTAVWFACDVGQFWLNNRMILDETSSNLADMFDIDFKNSKRNNLDTRAVLPNHAMIFLGCQKDDAGIQRWKVENSHSKYSNKDGIISMSDSWFDDYVICAAVPIDCLPKSKRNIKKVKYLPYYSVLGLFSH